MNMLRCVACPMQLRRDPCGLVCVLLVYSCIIYADYSFTIWMVLPSFGESVWGVVHIVIFNILLALVLLSHGRTMLSDPGIVPINKDSEMKNNRAGGDLSEDDSDSDAVTVMLPRGVVGEDWSVCTRCESFRPPRAHHCRVCRRCVRRMDHHCPWVNNCVGELNQKFFLQFLLYVSLTSAYSMMGVILSWMYHDEFGSTGVRGPHGQTAHHTKVLHTIFLCMESVLFGMFVCAISCDQLQAIFNDETAVEAVQRMSRRDLRRPRPPRTKLRLLGDVCGTGPLWTWLLPCTCPHSKRDNIRIPSAHYDV